MFPPETWKVIVGTVYENKCIYFNVFDGAHAQ